ncbi:C40 family peptidase [Chitinibacteraceae bacterium HSL-7]
MKRLAALMVLLLLAACSAPPKAPVTGKPAKLGDIQVDSGLRQEVLLQSMGLIGVEYRYGGASPEAGLDCSGMVAHVYRQAAGVSLPHNAAQIATLARPINDAQMKVGDLVFFNTSGKPFSHMGIYIGGRQFIHAPSSGGKVRLESLDKAYFARRYQGGRTLFER